MSDSLIMQCVSTPPVNKIPRATICTTAAPAPAVMHHRPAMHLYYLPDGLVVCPLVGKSHLLESPATKDLVVLCMCLLAEVLHVGAAWRIMDKM